MLSLTWLLFSSVLVLLVTYFLDGLIKSGFFHRTFDHFPGECVKFEGIDGSEDFVLMPNDHVLISSGITWWHIDKELPLHRSGVYMIDLNSDNPKLVNLTFEGSYRETISPDFSPHGMGHWISKDGEMILYIINHRRQGDVVDSFVYNPTEKSLKYRRSFKSQQFHDLNDLVLVNLDEFYVTVDHYFLSKVQRTIEVCFRLPLGQIIYVNGKGSDDVIKVAMDHLRYPNGLARSNNGRLIFLNELGEGQVNAYMRNGDNTLTLVQTLPLHVGNDNIFVSPKNGHLWVAVLTDGLQFFKYIYNHSIPMPGKIFHIAIDQNSDLPFTDCKIEEVVSNSGVKINAITTGLYHRGRLLLGTIRKDMMMCNVTYLMY